MTQRELALLLFEKIEGYKNGVSKKHIEQEWNEKSDYWRKQYLRGARAIIRRLGVKALMQS